MSNPVVIPWDDKCVNAWWCERDGALASDIEEWARKHKASFENADKRHDTAQYVLLFSDPADAIIFRLKYNV
jgi:hypothetical protein